MKHSLPNSYYIEFRFMNFKNTVVYDQGTIILDFELALSYSYRICHQLLIGI